jgi:hypothetical protein
LQALRTYLGVGSVRRKPARQPHHQPISEFSVTSMRQHRQATIPFAETFLPASAKREQFERWRAALQQYQSASSSRWGRGQSLCSVTGCERPVRGRGLCRSHYYRATGY